MKIVGNVLKKSVSILLLIVFTLSVTGCSRFDPEQYVESTLNFNFKGEVEAYAEFVNKSAESLQQEYDQMVADTDVENFKTFFDISFVSDETKEEIISFYKELFSHAKYNISGSEKSDDGYSVTVIVSPLDIFYQSNEDLNTFVAEFNENNQNFVYEDLTDEEYDDVYAQGILKVLNQHLESVGYLEDRTYTVKVIKSNNSYSIDSTSFDAVCQDVVAYELPSE